MDGRVLPLSGRPFSNDPLLPHLLDIVSDPASGELILGGGFGIRLKQLEIAKQGYPTLIASVPPARATQDLDFFLRIELWVQKERGQSVRAMLDRLGYETHSRNWQFGKPFAPNAPEHRVKVDLLARHPHEGEPVKVKDFRVGSKSGVDLHGYDTPEAFAIEERPRTLEVSGERSDNTLVTGAILVPHAYASLNMKVKAAHDWLQMIRSGTRPKLNAEKHVFDVYILVAMLLNEEVAECSELAARYTGYPMAEENRFNALELFGSQSGQGFTEVLRQIGGLPHDYATFWEGLREALGIIRNP